MSVIQIHCGWHERRVNIRTLRAQPGGGWDEAPDVSHRLKMASGASRERSIPEPAFRIMTGADGQGYLRWEFRCPLDPKHNVQVRQDKLNPALNQLAAVGESEVTLSALAAILEMLSRARPGA